MTLYQAVRQILAAAAPVTALVGSRIRPDKLDEGDDVPAIVIKISGVPDDDLEGLLDFGDATVTLFVWSEERNVTDDLMAKAAAALKAADVVGDLQLSVWNHEFDCDVDPAMAGADEKDWYRDDRSFLLQWQRT